MGPHPKLNLLPDDCCTAAWHFFKTSPGETAHSRLHNILLADLQNSSQLLALRHQHIHSSSAWGDLEAFLPLPQVKLGPGRLALRFSGSDHCTGLHYLKLAPLMWVSLVLFK